MNRAECIAAKVGSLPAAAAHRLANIPFSSSASTGIARLNQQTTFDIFPLRFFLISSFDKSDAGVIITRGGVIIIRGGVIILFRNEFISLLFCD